MKDVKPKIKWLKRGECIQSTVPRGTDFRVEFSGERILVFKLQKSFKFDRVGIFRADNWEGCEEGYGGFFFGKKK